MPYLSVDDARAVDHGGGRLDAVRDLRVGRLRDEAGADGHARVGADGLDLVVVPQSSRLRHVQSAGKTCQPSTDVLRNLHHVSELGHLDVLLAQLAVRGVAERQDAEEQQDGVEVRNELHSLRCRDLVFSTV